MKKKFIEYLDEELKNEDISKLEWSLIPNGNEDIDEKGLTNGTNIIKNNLKVQNVLIYEKPTIL